MTKQTTDMKKLVALDDEDLQVIAAYTQDAVVRVGDLTYLAKEKKFALALNRFVWEKEKKKGNERRRTALHFERVMKVQTRNIRREAQDSVLNLLTIQFVKTEDPSGHIELVFSDDGVVRLEVECIEAQLGDLGGAWETKSRPEHDLENEK